MLGSFRKSPDEVRALEQIERWTRERFELSPEAVVTASELACTLPGCPPLETVVAFWTADGARHHFKLFKRAHEVSSDDLPYRWLRDALVVQEGFDASCC
jgi:nitrate reductase delta subunit